MSHALDVSTSNNISNTLKKLEKIHILLIDNSTQVTELFKNMLMEFGFNNVFVANNGFQGVQFLREVKINLIITDWELKVPRHISDSDSNVISHTDILPLSGVDFVMRLRRSPSSPNPYIPVIMFTDTVEKMHVIAARDAGVNEICIKPLSAEELCKRIMAVIDKPRIFITSESYKGPDRRRKKSLLPVDGEERRKREVRIIKCNESVRR